MGIFNADVIINIPPAFFSLQKSGLVRVYLTSVFLLLSVPRCFGDQKPQFDYDHAFLQPVVTHAWDIQSLDDTSCQSSDCFNKVPFSIVTCQEAIVGHLVKLIQEF